MRLVAHWRAGRRRYKELDPPFGAAIDLLRLVLQRGDVLVRFGRHVSGIASGCSMPHCTSVRRSDSGRQACIPVDLFNGLPGSVMSHGNPAASPGHDETPPREGGMERAIAVPGISGEARTAAQVSMLGASAEVTAVAADGLFQLRQVHEEHGRVIGQIRTVQNVPGALLEPLKLARVLGAHVMSRGIPADMMQLCQLAEAEQRWRDTFAPPEGVSRPLPGYEWLQGVAEAPASPRKPRFLQRH